jgi:hypothetical protein
MEVRLAVSGQLISNLDSNLRRPCKHHSAKSLTIMRYLARPSAHSAPDWRQSSSLQQI